MGIGRYRVRFYENNTSYKDEILFQYWLSRSSRKIYEKDPMNEAIETLKPKLKGIVIEYRIWEFDPEKIMAENPEWI
jgi:hypothetical protein